MISRRGLLGVAASGALLPAADARAARRLTIIIPFNAGSSNDLSARAFAPFLLKQLPSTEIAFHNIPGDGGLVGFQALIQAVPSGATLGWVPTPNLPARMVDREGTELLKGMTLLGAVEREPIAFVSPDAAPLDSVQDILERASQDSDAMPLGTPPAGSPPHLAVQRLQRLAKTRLTIVTFPSAAAARQAVIDGNVSAAVLGLSDVIDAIRDGRLSCVGIAANRRTVMLPDVPVLNEAGVPLSASIRRGLAAPAGLPGEMRERLIAALRDAAKDAAFKEMAEHTGYVATWMSGADWTTLAETERADLAKLWAADAWLSSSGG